jgi:hypothetical protein
MELKSYVLIKNISNNLNLKIASGQDVIPELESYGITIAETVCEDFYNIFNERLIIDDLYFYFDDENYRQRSTAYIINAHFVKYQNTTVRFECLIDFQKILLRVKGKLPDNNKIEKIIYHIEMKYNQEGFAELPR